MKNSDKIILFAEDASKASNPTTPTNSKPTRPANVSDASKRKASKWGKTILILALVFGFFFTIWWFSTPHYKKVKVTTVDYANGKILINGDLHCDPKSLKVEYYINDSSKSIYHYYLNSEESGKIQVIAQDSVSDETITVGSDSKLATVHHMMIGSFQTWYAIGAQTVDPQEYYVPDAGDKWTILPSTTQVEKNKLALYTTINDGIIDARIPATSSLWSTLMTLLPTLLIFGLFIWYFSKMSKMQGGEEGLWSVGKSQAKLAKSDIKFLDVAGLKEEKEELIEIVDYLKHPNKYAAMGARAPKGVILYGPPGTGKTLLAKAVAGEANVPFYQSTGSAFEDMLVGVGAKRVRDLFNNAKKTSPSIIFIDEFDSVAAKRGKMDIAGGGGGVADQTINQLLAEMDGFSTKTGVVVIAATNRLDVLDDAILRPGRFDRHVQVNLPDIKEREAILKIHAKNKNISSKVNLNDIARRTPGFSGAQLENVLNEATLLAVRFSKQVVGLAEIEEGIDRVIAGPAKHSRVITEDEKKQIAYHEAGHALIGLNVPGSDIVEKITIIPRGQAAGYTLVTPEKQEISIQKKSDLLAIVASTLGGRAAEEIVYGVDSISTGASNDLYKITNIVRAMVTQLGMTKTGMTQFVPSEGLTNPYSKNYSELTAQKIDAEIEMIIQNEYSKAKVIIKNNREELDLIVRALLALETIVRSQIAYIHEHKKLPQEVIDKEAEAKAFEAAKKADPVKN